MKTIKYILILVIVGLMSSCLEYGLDELPAYDGVEMTNIKFEYRSWDTEGNHVDIQSLGTSVELDSATFTYNCEVRLTGEASLDSLVCFCDVSIGATISPIEGAPTLGRIGDYSKQGLKYKVTAANGDSRIYTLNVTER